MDKIKPNYTNLGLSSSMGPNLRIFVERQLADDLRNYGISLNQVKFDWSDSCIEGHDTYFLDGSLENFSGIAVFDVDDTLIAEGWMEFIHEQDFFLAYWEYVSTFNGNKKVSEKTDKGIPAHIWTKIPDGIKPVLVNQEMKGTPWNDRHERTT